MLSEGAAIVLSILLAFAIDAWWQQRGEDARAAALVDGLRADFEASQVQIARWLGGNRRMLEAEAELLATLRSAPAGTEIDVPATLLLGAIGAPTYSPTDSTYQAALSSGQIRLIENTEIHEALARWRQLLADTAEDELLLREIVVHRLVPELAKSVRLSDYFEFDRLLGWFMGNDIEMSPREVRLLVTSELEGELAERLFYQTFVVDGLTEIQATQADILKLLAARFSTDRAATPAND